MSTDPSHAAELIAEPGIDGLFVGRSAWQPDGYVEIMRRAAEAIARES